METNLEQLIAELDFFAKERDWEQYRHPKNLVMSLSVEISELAEHFLKVSDLESYSLMDQSHAIEIEYEIADVFNGILMLCKAFQTDLSKIASPLGDPTTKVSPKQLISHLVVAAGALMEHFIWNSEEELKHRKVSHEVLASLSSVYALFLSLSNSLQVNPIEASIKKLVVLRKKYPADLVKGSVEKYHARKKSIKNP